MKRMTITLLLVAVSCQTVPKSPQDSSKPDVQIKVQKANNQFEHETDMNLSVGGSVKLMCIVSDPQGVKSIQLSFSGHSDGCNVKGTIWTGGFAIKPMPASMSQQLQGNANDQVLTSVPLIADLNGPFECSVFKPPCAEPGDDCSHGQPFGGTITVKCNGGNWSSDPQNQSAQATLAIHLQ